MKAFPMFLATTGRRIVILGGGEQAAQKARLVIRTDAEIVVAGFEFDEELRALAQEGRVRLEDAKEIRAGLFERAALVFVATGSAGADGALHALAKALGAPVVNVVDRPALCDALTPSIVDRDPVVVAIGTEGTAPVLGRQIKTAVETMLEPRLGALAALAGRMRGAVGQRFSARARRDFWVWVFSGPVRAAHAAGSERRAAQLLKARLDEGPGPVEGSVAYVGAGPGEADLLSLRGVRRMQEADLVVHGPDLPPALLELARRDAERLVSDDPVSAGLAAAQEGARVVVLVPGAAATLPEPLQAAHIAVEHVPGVG
ncbi:MAG: NAD(P)-dependent oxidoreductase [Limimaricola soesokkakensis]|uniref:precorrin-2 dehydrogenase n=1 Tax=Limimaricola soesokkakensis TaxID=1343159 RepID=A0A1X6YWG0_9RHOB|nr:NAD(P)-dependent oxidoreductase [Limimaricola soesokkakensis]PSK87743.1 uroporphyrin-III C-methyltransferase/precorrin-2 dehydrogenase/sirohydrochlorin ferrochelatase [Limimaricola soesokkakensis]SLN33660.1 Siroheme synthase [Limimaricola soesokkakensis]